MGLAHQTDPLASTSVSVDGAQHFTVDTAGAVDVSVGASGVQLDLVSPNPGWTATPVAATDADVAVTFTNGTRTLEFSATVGPDGTAIGDLTEAATAAAPSSSSSDHHDTTDDHKRRPMGTDALGAQSIGELLQMQIHAKHPRDAAIDVIHGL